ncbi:MAG: universal stress protein [Anaerolineae bacterium]|jgi:nucleotide-binding universal stress UspA family protein
MMYKRILLPLDGSATSEQALPHAIAQAKQFGAMLILLRVLEPLPHVRGMSAADISSIRQQTSEWAQEYVDQLVTNTREKGISAQAAIVEGQPNVTILQFAERNQVDLIVICSRGRSGFSRWLMGSVADRVVRGATVPVLLVRTKKEET